MPIDALGMSPLHYSAHFGHLDATKSLLNATGNNSSYITQQGFEEANYYTPFNSAVNKGQRAIVKLFLDKIVGNKNPKGAFTNYMSIILALTNTYWL